MKSKKCLEDYPENEQLDCPHMKYKPDKGGMEADVHECGRCGARINLYYEDMQ